MTNDQTVTQALEPCPWCGTSEHLSVQSVGALTSDMPDRPYRTICTHIDHDTVIGPTAYGKRAAITAWNTRTAHSGEGRDNAAGFISVREHREGFPLNEAWLLYGHGDEEVIAQKIVRIDRKTLLGQALPADVVRLVIAARKIALNDWDGDSEEWAVARKELDQASEAFASRVPWDNEPNDAALSAPQGEVERLRAAMKQAEIHIDCASFRKAQDILRAALAQPEAGGE